MSADIRSYAHFVSRACDGEFCRCGANATHKVGEEITFDLLPQARHNLTAYVCCDHFGELFPMARATCYPQHKGNKTQ